MSMGKIRLLLLSAPVGKSKVSLRRAKQIGIAGIKLVRSREIPAMDPASTNHPDLTRRQTQVLRGLALGYRTKEIAGQLRLSIKTVETYRAQLVKVLGISHVPGFVRYALRSGVVPASWLFD
jgi:DNA-binding NarL/FixJ family response regulator